MQNCKQSLLKRLLSMLVGTAMMATMITVLIPLPVANAVGADNTYTAKFNSTNARNFLALEFTNPICGDPSCTTAVDASDFTFTNGNAGGFASINSCTHTVGSRIVVCVMNTTSVAGDTADTIFAKSGAVWSVDGSVPSGSGETVALTSAGDTTGPSAVIYVDAGANLSDKIVVQYSEPVVQSTAAAVAAGNFAYGEAGAGTAASISSAMQTKLRSGSNNYVVLRLNGAFAEADETDTLTLNATVYDIYGNVIADPEAGGEDAAIAAAVTLAVVSDGVDENPAAAPTISTSYAKANITSGPMLVEFSYPVMTTGANTGALDSLATTDIQYGGADVEAVVSHTAGDSVAIFRDTTAALTTIAAATGTSIYTPWNVAMGTGAVATDDVTNPVPTYVGINQYIDPCDEDESGTDGGGDTYGAIADGEMTIVTTTTTDGVTVTPQEGWGMCQLLSTADYADNDGFLVDLNHDIYDDTNSLYEFTSVQFDTYIIDADAATGLSTDGVLAFVVDNATADITTDTVEWNINTDIAEKTWTTITVDLTAAPNVGTLAALGTNPQFWGLKITGAPGGGELDANDYIFVDNVKFIRGASSKSNNIYLKYAEWVELASDPVEGATAASSAGVADMTTDKTLAGFGVFNTGALTTKTLTNTVAKDTATVSNGTVYDITLANRSGGLITTASPVTLSSTFTPVASITDKDSNTIAAGSTVVATVGNALDLTTAATAPTDFVPTLVTGGQVRLGWTAPSQTAATFSHYAVTYGTGAGVTVASTLWDEASDATLSTGTTNTTTVTSLTDGTVYYFNIAAVDVKGLGTTLVTEKSALPSAASGSKAETVAPAIPSNIKATVNSAGKVVLTWSDPADTDLSYMNLAKSIGKDVVPASVLTTLNPGVKTYTDSAVAIGDVVNYKMNAVDKSGNSSAYSAVVSVTVKLPDAAAPATEPATGDAAAAADEAAAETGEEGATEEGAEDTGVEEGDDDSSLDEGTVEEEDEGEAEVSPEVKLTDISTHWAKKEVEAMVEAGVIKGYKDGSFKPNNNLNRAESGILLCRVLGIDESEPADADPFTDVKKDAWYGGCVAELKAAMIVKGNPDKTYKPMSNINRAEFITLVMRAYSDMLDEEEKADLDAMLNASEPKASFSDVNAKTDWYANVAYSAMNKGFVKGRACGADKKDMCFDGGTSITRAEATTVLYRVFGDML